KTLIDELGDFVNNVYFQDVCVIGANYKDWTAYGAGVMNYLSVPEFPMDTKGTVFEHPGGYIPDGDIGKFRRISGFQDEFIKKGVQESIKHSWYDGSWTRNPWDEDTDPHYTDFQDDGKYSWVKAPTFNGNPAQVGPLANVLCMYAAGHAPTIKYTEKALAAVSSLAGEEVRFAALHSTIGRHAASAVRAAVLYQTLQTQMQALLSN